MGTKHTATIDELLGKFKRQPLQIENTNPRAPGLELERELRTLLSVNPDTVMDQLQEILKAGAGTPYPPRNQSPRSDKTASTEALSPQKETSVDAAARAFDHRESAHPRSKLGRNQPCWCGSGMKYKQCHYPN